MLWMSLLKKKKQQKTIMAEGDIIEIKKKKAEVVTANRGGN